MSKKIKLRRMFSLFMTMAFTLGLLPNVSFADDGKVFNDVDDSATNFKAIQYLKDQKVVRGYDDGSYKPKSKINRAEFLKIVMEASGKKPEGKDCYKDVKEAWYSGYVCAATKLKLVKGYDGGMFKPEQPISFAEAAKIIVNTLGVKMEDGVGEEAGDAWYKGYVNALEKKEAIPDDIATFGYNVTRGQMAEMVWRVKESPSYVQAIGYDTLKRRTMAAGTGGKLQKFSSCVDLKDYLQENSKPNYREMKTFETMSAPMDAAADESATAGAAVTVEEYSTTNIQVAGVDEADIVKNDGKYIYLVKGNTVRVVQAYPAAEMKELSRVQFDRKDFYPSDMYVDGNKLVVIGTAYDSLWNQPYVSEKSGKMPIIAGEYYYGGMTKMYIFDVSDHSAIKKFRDLSYEGNYTSSRKIGDMVYLVMNKPEYRYVLPIDWSEHDIVPLYKDSSVGKVETMAGCDDIMYLPGSQSTNYIVVSGVSIADKTLAPVDRVVIGSTGSIYASPKNLYVAETKYPWFHLDYDNQPEEQTTVHKFSLSKENINYLGKNDVSGHIINQFSMDEYKDNFRIATTIGHAWDTVKKATSGVYTLDEDLKMLGKVDGIAPGEEIYSTRFVGDRVYMVTFKKVDPFFVIDLSDAVNPRILGKLKIPGFSDYLHPYDENHIIGFGKNALDASTDETEQRQLDFAWYQGVKIAMFDVTDVTNPVEMFKVEIGDRGTDTPVLNDHKALLFDKNKGLMVLPVTVAEVSQAQKDDPQVSKSTYGSPIFQGAYVYNVSLDKGFELRGKISHYTENEVKDKAGYYWSGNSDIQRALYIGEYLYTVSQSMVRANNLSDLLETGSVKLGE